ncbi:MAG: DNA mismatch endonuclease Vsr [Phycisphaerae bacterium]
MLDRFTQAERSRIMRLVKGKNTEPEITVRKMLHDLGFRFRLYRDDLPGKPDIVLPRWKAVIFVNGCFWHQHAGCSRAARPRSNARFWNRKLDRNVVRDHQNVRRLRADGWRTITLWECRIKDTPALRQKLERFIRKARPC